MRKRDTTTEVAELLDVSAQTVQMWMDTGHLSAFKTYGGHRRIDAASVEVMLKSRRIALKNGAPFSIALIQGRQETTAAFEAALATREAPAPQVFDDPVAALIAIGAQPPSLVVAD